MYSNSNLHNHLNHSSQKLSIHLSAAITGKSRKKQIYFTLCLITPFPPPMRIRLTTSQRALFFQVMRSSKSIMNTSKKQITNLRKKKKKVHKYNQHHITLDLASPILSYAFQHKSPHRTIPYFFVSSIFPCQLFSFKLNQAQNSAHLFLPILLFQPAYVLTTTVYPTLSLALQLLLVFLLSNEDIKELVKRISQNPIVDQLTSHSCILQ